MKRKKNLLAILISISLAATMCFGGMSSVFADGDEGIATDNTSAIENEGNTNIDNNTTGNTTGDEVLPEDSVTGDDNNIDETQGVSNLQLDTQGAGENKVTITIEHKYYDATVLSGDINNPTPADGELVGVVKQIIIVDKGSKVTVTPDYESYKTLANGAFSDRDFVWVGIGLFGAYNLDMNAYGVYSSVDFTANYNQTVSVIYRKAYNPIWVYANVDSTNQPGDWTYKGNAVDEEAATIPTTGQVRQDNSFTFALTGDYSKLEYYGCSIWSNSQWVSSSNIGDWNLSINDSNVLSGTNAAIQDWAKSSGVQSVSVYLFYRLKTFTTTVNFIDSETGEEIQDSIVSPLTNIDTAYDLNQYTSLDGYVFDRAEGDSLSGTLDGNKEVTLYFTVARYTTTVNFVNSATNEVIQAPVVSEPTAVGTEYDLTQYTSLAGYTYDRAEGDMTGTLDGNKEVTLYFTVIPPTVGPIPVNPPTTPPTNPTPIAAPVPGGAGVINIADNTTPLADGVDNTTTNIADNATPKGALADAAWALLNLILAILTVLVFVVTPIIGYRKKQKETKTNDEQQQRIDAGQEEEPKARKRFLYYVLGILVAVVGVVFFILTEDMSLPMQIIDKWTIWSAIIALVEIVVFAIAIKKKNNEKEAEQQA